MDDTSGRRLGERESFAGYVTKLSAVAARRRWEIEQRLGFAPGALNGGYYLYALDGSVSANDFDWKDRTAYSDGWHYDWSIGEYVQRRDELRAEMGKRTGYNEQAADSAIAKIMEKHVTALNVRSGPERIVKVIPRGAVSGYPDSPYRDVPQWKLKTPHPFMRLETYEPE